jgi:hypothetical protein
MKSDREIGDSQSEPEWQPSWTRPRNVSPAIVKLFALLELNSNHKPVKRKEDPHEI